jgi:NADP-dependent 3-hydroxy acid dehydrogenase YdfG|tara:strand:+ start:225 stop:986 length:762 start_codon:yes stop_codon:yes gene_type:complete
MPIALITGTTAGIGAAAAQILAKNGYDLILNGRRNDRLEEQSRKFTNQYGIKTKIMHIDIRNHEEVEKYIANLSSEWLSIDVLINNAGLAAGLNSIESGSIDHWNRMIDTNIKGLLHITKYMTPILKKTQGHIINIGSIAGKEVYLNGNVYCGTKHMVDALNKAMRKELAQFGVRVTSINPGAVETEFSIVRLDGNTEKAKNVYVGFENLVAQDIADAIWFTINRPKHVNINELIIMPTAQPAAGEIIRNKGL